MLTPQQKQTLSKLLKKYGEVDQVFDSVQTLNDLTTILCASLHLGYSENRDCNKYGLNKVSIKDEIAECYIMLDKLRTIYGVDSADLQYDINRKMKDMKNFYVG